MVAVAVAANALLLERPPLTASVPSEAVLGAAVVAGLMLTANHSWLMTATELTRARYGLLTTPEEWARSGRSVDETPTSAAAELARNHNAHRNATENTVHFVWLATLVLMSGPPPAAALTWLVGYALARLGHTYGYLFGHDGLRGIFMSFSLVALYGLASHLVLRVWA